MQESRGNRKGVLWWWIQRFTAVVLLLLLCHVGYWLASTGPLTYESYNAYLDQPLVLILGVLSVLSIVLHGLFGMWGVLTDYMNRRTGGKLGYKLWPYLFGLFIMSGVVSIIWTLQLLAGF